MTDFPDWGICLTQVARVLWSDVGRAPSPAAGPLAGLPAGGRPPRSRGTTPPSRCQSDYLSQADTPHNLFNLQQPLPDGRGSESASERSAELFRNGSSPRAPPLKSRWDLGVKSQKSGAASGINGLAGSLNG